jgi:acetylornithine deacetylase/succinyl-diaminopimelate desuccinylase-like protein
VSATAAEVTRCVEDACAICEIPAPTGDEGRRADWVAAQLRVAGLDADMDGAGSVIARAGPPEGAPIVVAAHLDTVFPGVEDITARREGELLHGPGIGDNSLGVAALLFLARRLGAQPPRRPVVLAATVGEEGFGNLRGARAAVEALHPAEFIALEGGGVGEIVVTGVGSARFAIRVRVPGGHSWRDRAEPSAVHVLIDLLAGPLAHPGTASRNVGSIRGGAGINVLAPEAEATFEFRDLDTGKLDAAADRLAAAVRAANAGGVTVELEELGRRPGGEIAAEHPLVRDAVAAAVGAGLGRPHLAEASTDANAALGAGVPAITIGLCTSHDAHTREEWVDVAQLGPSLGALADLLERRGG